jgi:hypothetical protein
MWPCATPRCLLLRKRHLPSSLPSEALAATAFTGRLFQQQVLDLDDGNVLVATDREILGVPPA